MILSSTVDRYKIVVVLDDEVYTLHNPTTDNNRTRVRWPLLT